MSDSELFLKSKIAVRFRTLLSGLVYYVIAHVLFNVQMHGHVVKSWGIYLTLQQV